MFVWFNLPVQNRVVKRTWLSFLYKPWTQWW
ncbi:MAG: hypothetical protein K0S97_527 [Chloroflexota bacterium]|nr:hypothetical protein [Chloroflexota bacterium]